MQIRSFNYQSEEFGSGSQSASPFFYIGDEILSENEIPSSVSKTKSEDVPDGMNSKSEYINSYSSLVTNKTHSSSLVGPQSNLNISKSSPVAKVNVYEHDSEHGSSNSNRNSVTSHDLAISLLDEVLANSASQDLSTALHSVKRTRYDSNSSPSDITPPISDGNSSRRSSKMSTSSDPVLRDRLARTAAAAIIAKLVKSCMDNLV